MAPKNRVMVFGVDIKVKPRRKPNKIKGKKLIKFGDLMKSRPVPPPQEQLPLMYLKFILSKGVNRDSLQLILVKRLEMTDINEHHARLSLPKEKIRKRFLSDEEEEFLKGVIKQGERPVKKKMKVSVVDPRLSIHEMNFAKWNDPEPKEGEKKKSWWFALNKGWIDLVGVNGLEEGDAIQVWSFRFGEDNHLGFIIQKVDEGWSWGSGSGSSSSSGSSLSLGLGLSSGSGSISSSDSV